MPVAEPAAGVARHGASDHDDDAVVYGAGSTEVCHGAKEASKVYIDEAARQRRDARGNTARCGADYLKHIERQRRVSESLQEEGFLAPGEFLEP